MAGPDWEDEPERWVEQRARFLSSSEIGLRDKVATAVAYSELGHSRSGIAREMDTRESTVDNYLSTARRTYPGILVRLAPEFDGEIDADVSDLEAPPPRECPVCTEERLVTPAGADRLYMTSGWGSDEMMEDADMVCVFCHSVRIDGKWKRMQSVDSRAWSLSQEGSKSHKEYEEMLTAGIDPDENRDRPTVDDAEGW